MKGIREFFVLNFCSFSVSELCQKLKENLHNISIMPLEVILGQNEESKLILLWGVPQMWWEM